MQKNKTGDIRFSWEYQTLLSQGALINAKKIPFACIIVCLLVISSILSLSFIHTPHESEKGNSTYAELRRAFKADLEQVPSSWFGPSIWLERHFFESRFSYDLQQHPPLTLFAIYLRGDTFEAANIAWSWPYDDFLSMHLVGASLFSRDPSTQSIASIADSTRIGGRWMAILHGYTWSAMVAAHSHSGHQYIANFSDDFCDKFRNHLINMYAPAPVSAIFTHTCYHGVGHGMWRIGVNHTLNDRMPSTAAELIPLTLPVQKVTHIVSEALQLCDGLRSFSASIVCGTGVFHDTMAMLRESDEIWCRNVPLKYVVTCLGYVSLRRAQAGSEDDESWLSKCMLHAPIALRTRGCLYGVFMRSAGNQVSFKEIEKNPLQNFLANLCGSRVKRFTRIVYAESWSSANKSKTIATEEAWELCMAAVWSNWKFGPIYVKGSSSALSSFYLAMCSSLRVSRIDEQTISKDYLYRICMDQVHETKPIEKKFQNMVVEGSYSVPGMESSSS